jgi:CheY-like chemotaxis protein
VLVSAGFQVTSAPGGNEAIALLEATPRGFDLILTDYNMPRRSGFDVARAAAALAPGLPVLLASGFITDEVRRGAAELGIKQLLSKPFSTEDLVAAVLRALGVSVGPPT